MLSKFNLTRPIYHVDLTADVGGGFAPGMGLILSDPAYPVRAPVTAFEMPAAKDAYSTLAQPLRPVDIVNASIRYRASASAHEEARMLSAYFRASFPFGGFSAAYSEALRTRETSRTTYALIEYHGPTLTLPEIAIDWADEKVTAESETDETKRLQRFVYTFGSHYVSSLVFGFRVAVRAQVNTTDMATFQKIRASFEAAIGASSAGGGIDSHHSKTLKSSNTEIMAEIVAGGITPTSAYILTGLDDVATFLRDLRTGKTQISAAPTRAIAFSYWATLAPDKFPRCSAVLAEEGPAAPTALHGVPRGTVVPWMPPPENVIAPDDPEGKSYIIPPEGWAVCDGVQAPDLRDRFVRGATGLESAGTIAGVDQHSHGYRMFGATMDNDKAAPAYDVKYDRDSAFVHSDVDGGYRNHAHRLTIESATNLPPCVSLIYIMKL